MEQFPREISPEEKEILFELLPENKSGYNEYREKINNAFIIGFGRFGTTNMILGAHGSIPDLSASSSVFVAGTVYYEEEVVDVSINEELYDQIECDISPRGNKKISPNLTFKNKITYSEWNPGDKAPGDESNVREVTLASSKLTLAIATTHKKLWVHNHENGVNYLIPVSNFYNNLMIHKKIRTKEITFNPSLLFKNLDNFSDEDLISAFYMYNKYMKRFSFEYLNKNLKPRKKKIFRLYRKEKN